MNKREVALIKILLAGLLFCVKNVESQEVCDDFVFAGEYYLPRPENGAITFEKNGGRLGDIFLSLSHALWFAKEYGMTLFVPKFTYSDQLRIHDYLPVCTESVRRQYNIVKLPRCKNPPLFPEKGRLYITQWETRASIVWHEQQEFVALLKKFLSPKEEVVYIQKPADCVTVALHLRMGGEFAFDHRIKHRLPHKFPPFHFYVDQLERLLQLYPDQKLYVHIFTDDSSPQRLRAMLESALRERNVSTRDLIFGYRKTNNRHDANVLEDFFNMMEFDVLVRPQSGLSMFSQRLGNHSLVIAPKSHVFISKREWKITSVSLTYSATENSQRVVKVEPSAIVRSLHNFV